MSSGEERRCTLMVTNEGGLHAGPASQLVQTANGFSADVRICHGGSCVDARSVLGLLTLGIVCGTEVEIVCSGADAPAAMEAVSALFQAGFHE